MAIDWAAARRQAEQLKTTLEPYAHNRSASETPQRPGKKGAPRGGLRGARESGGKARLLPTLKHTSEEVEERRRAEADDAVRHADALAEQGRYDPAALGEAQRERERGAALLTAADALARRRSEFQSLEYETGRAERRAGLEGEAALLPRGDAEAPLPVGEGRTIARMLLEEGYTPKVNAAGGGREGPLGGADLGSALRGAVPGLAASYEQLGGAIGKLTGSEGTPYENLNFLTDGERETLTAFAQAGQYDKVKAYYEAIARDLNARMTGEQARHVDELPGAAGVAARAVLPVAANLYAPAAYFQALGAEARDLATGSYTPVDVNAGPMATVRLGNAAQARTVGDLEAFVEEKTGSKLAAGAAGLLTETGYSILNNAVNLAWGPGVSLAMMGLQSAGQSTTGALEKGATTGQALTAGTLSGAIEMLTEKIPVDNLFRLVRGGRRTTSSAVRELLRQMGIEATEETVGSYLNLLNDVAVMGEKSEYAQYKATLMADGMSEEEAAKEANARFFVAEPLKAGLGGAISGGVMGGGALALGAAGARAQTRTENRAIDSAYEAMGEHGLFTPESWEAQQQASRTLGLPARESPMRLITREEAAQGEAAAPVDTQDHALPGGQKNTASSGETEQITSAGNMQRYRFAIDGVFSGELPSGSDITVGKTPSILVQYGAPAIKLHMSQRVARKIAYPLGYLGGKHNLGLSALKNLPYQIADPLAIVDNPQSNSKGLASKIIITEWADVDGKPVIVPIHLNAQGAIDVQNNIASAFGADYIKRILGDNNKNVLYTKNNEDIHQLLSKGRPMPQAMADDVLARNSISRNDENSNPEPVQNSGEVTGPHGLPRGDGLPPESVGAARAGFDPWSSFQGHTDEFHPEGEKAYRQVDVPTTDLEGRRISKSAATVMEAQAVPDAMVAEIEQAILRGTFSYRMNTDRGAMARAEQTIRSIGWDGAMERFHQASQRGEANKDMMALGATLLNNAANSRNGEALALVLADYSAMSRRGAQTTQANRLLKQMSPQWQLAAIQRSVDNLNEANRNREPGGRTPAGPGAAEPGGAGLPGGDTDPRGGKRAAKARSEAAGAQNVPVELWMQRVGENLADSLMQRVNAPKEQVRTVCQTILSDLTRYASETAPKAGRSAKRTQMDRILDLFHNQTQYQEALDAAKATLSDAFENDPDTLAAFDQWLDSAPDYAAMLTEELTGQSEIQIDPALVDRFLTAKDQKARDAILSDIYQNVADQIPSTWQDKWNAWRYLAMLFNPRTHVRNIVGNAGFAPVRAVKNEIGAALERLASAATGGKVERTKSFVFAPALYRAALADFAEVRDQAMGGRKYDDFSGEIHDRRTIFKNNGDWGTLPTSSTAARGARAVTGALQTGAEWARRFNSNLLELEDLFFSKTAYADSLAGYLNANGVKAEALRAGTVDAELLDAARAYAIQEAQKATYRDNNDFSNWVAGLFSRARRSDSKVVRGLGMLGEGILPFKRTPANILVRGVEYSPLGLAKTLFPGKVGLAEGDLYKLRHGELSAAEFIDNAAAGLTGTGLFALGALLAGLGAVSGGGSGDDDQDRLDDLTGKQDYAMRLPDGTWVTLDWLAPEALPFFMGVEYANLGAENGLQMKDLWEAGKRLTDPLLEMSMLQSLNDILSRRGFQDTGMGEIVASALSSYVTQGIPTLGGQIERTGEDRRETTYPDPDGRLPTGAQYVLGKVMNKLPGEYRQIPYIDAWGRQEETGSGLERAFHNFLNPAYVSRENITELDREVQRLYDQTGAAGVIPSRADRAVTVAGERVELDAEQFVQYATEKGQGAYETASALLECPLYDTLTDEAKAEVVRSAYAWADATAKEALGLGYEPDNWVATAGALSAGDRAEYLIMRKVLGDAGGKGEGKRDRQRSALLEMDGLTDEEKAWYGEHELGDSRALDYSDEDALAVSLLAEGTREKAERAGEAGIDNGVFLAAYEAQSGVQGDKDENGKTISLSASRNKKEAIDAATSGLSREQRQLLYEMFGVSRQVWFELPRR